MRPKTSREDLPKRGVVRNYISNQFVKHMEHVKIDISNAPGDVSANWDMLTKANTSEPFLGMLGFWIEVLDTGKWKLRTEVLALHRVFGDHGGDNLGKYFIRLTDRAGLTSRTHNKVRNHFVLSKPILMLFVM